MRCNAILTVLAVLATGTGYHRVLASDVVVEVEALELSNASIEELEGASGKVVAFDTEGAQARGQVELDRGQYMITVYVFAPDGEHDAIYLAVGQAQERLYPPVHGTTVETGAMFLDIREKKSYPLSITFGEPGVLIDRVVFRRLASAGQEVLPEVEPGPTDGRPRVIVTTDGEIDDECSMVRFLLYANEFDVEAIILSSSQYHWQGHQWAGDDWVDKYLDAYAQVYPNLVKHDPRYPTPDYLRARTLLGNVKVEADMSEPSPGSQYIVKVLLDEADPEPVWLQAWGGVNTIARALKTVEQEHPDKMAQVAKKIRLFCIWEQDSTYQDYIRPHWAKYNILTIISDQFEAIAYRWKNILPEEFHRYFAGAWMKEHILDGHGSLCALYKAHKAGDSGFEDGDFRSEGDSPAFLHNIVTGLRNMESPDWGGWGGRYVRVRENTWLDSVPVKGYVYPEGRWYSGSAWGRMMTSKGATSTTNKDYKGYFKPIWRWAAAIQNDFAARADWCVKPYDQANHPPKVRLAHATDLTARPGQRVRLSAEGSTDPDGDGLGFQWWQYYEADTYGGTIEITDAGKKEAWFVVPDDARTGQTIHVVCEVTDEGTPPLTRYERVIVRIGP